MAKKEENVYTIITGVKTVQHPVFGAVEWPDYLRTHFEMMEIAAMERERF
jgi:hypothetical protein